MRPNRDWDDFHNLAGIIICALHLFLLVMGISVGIFLSKLLGG